MRTEFFIAPRWETPRVESLDDVLQLSPTLRSHNVLPETLADLDFIVTGETDREPDVLSGAEDPVGVMRLADEFVEALATLPGGRREASCVAPRKPKQVSKALGSNPEGHWRMTYQPVAAPQHASHGFFPVPLQAEQVGLNS